MSSNVRKTARRSFGSVRQLPSKRYQAFYFHEGMRHVAPSTYRSLQDARAWLTTEEAKTINGSWFSPNSGRQTVADLSKQWLSSNPGKRASSLERDEIVVRRHLVPVLGGRPISSIKPIDIQNLVNEWSKERSAATVSREYDVVRAIFNYAVETDLLMRTPCRRIRLPEVIPRKHIARSPQDVALLAATISPQFSLMVWIGAVLGLRWSEVAAIRVGSFDDDLGRLAVREQVIRAKTGGKRLGPPKSRNANREMSLPTGLQALVEQHMRDHAISKDDSGAFLFTNDAGQPLDYSNFRRRHWLPAVEAAGMPSTGFHDLRRTSCTALVNEKIDMKTTMTRLGHSDARITLALYAQATTEADQIAADRLGNKFFPVVA